MRKRVDDKITLDRETFKALAIDTRINILKKLDDRFQLTLTDIAKELDMAPSTIKEHLGKLVSAGLIIQIDKGMKWKYYRLTSKGKKILNPQENRVWIILSVSVLGLFAAVYRLLLSLQEFTRPSLIQNHIAEPTGGMNFMAEEAKRDFSGAAPNMIAKEGVEKSLDDVTTSIAWDSVTKVTTSIAPDSMEDVATSIAQESMKDMETAITPDSAADIATSVTQPFISTDYSTAASQIPYPDLMIVLILVLLVGISVGYLIRKKQIL